MSRFRTTFSPSIFTSIDHAAKIAEPRLFAETSPFVPAFPASSPDVFLNELLSFSATGFPQIKTLVLPSVRSLAIPVFGYGIGTPGGVGGACGGVKQTSGIAAIDLPSDATLHGSIPLTKTLLPTKWGR
jgi:hypothetical protein